MNKTVFGKSSNGQEVFLYTLENQNGMKAEITDFGANLVALYVPDKNGNIEDVVLGFDNAEGYYDNAGFFGCTIGPNANRTKDGVFEINGTTYQLDKNDNGNNLHSHRELGFHKRVWEVKQKDNTLFLSLFAKDGEIGFPGNREIKLTYTLTEENELKIHYEAVSDKETIFNMTNHSYFNLAGHGSGNILGQALKMNASFYTPVAEGSIPTGEIASVKGTPMDFTEYKTIGQDIEKEFEQLAITNGFDHNYVVDDYDGSLRKIAEFKDEASGRIMETFTDLPGVQVYSGNYIEKQVGKKGAVYDFRGGICFETQVYPNSANEADFPDVIYGPNRNYETETIYKFKISE